MYDLGSRGTVHRTPTYLFWTAYNGSVTMRHAVARLDPATISHLETTTITTILYLDEDVDRANTLAAMAFKVCPRQTT